jgi:FKBP-type peptidyl-prolyl cis-trans isomerase FklB
MKLTGLLAGAALFSLLGGEAAEPKALTSQKEKASYGIGMNVATRFKSDAIDLDVDAFVRGFKDALAEAKPAVSEQEIRQAITAMTEEVQKKMSEQGEKNKAAGEAFLAKNKKEKGITTTGSGLQYQVLREGNGAVPKETDKVKVHYKGTLMDGTVFDSSYDRNEPISFPVTGVIKGWVEALQKMKVGSKWKLFIPSDLAYGEGGQGKIPPNSPLIFEVELLDIEK